MIDFLNNFIDDIEKTVEEIVKEKIGEKNDLASDFMKLKIENFLLKKSMEFMFKMAKNLKNEVDK